eukprot:1523163-Prymnesium_polylepis.1
MTGAHDGARFWLALPGGPHAWLLHEIILIGRGLYREHGVRYLRGAYTVLVAGLRGGIDCLPSHLS